MFELRNIIKFCEEDDYEKGCILGTSRAIDIDVTLKAETLDELIEKAQSFFGGNVCKDLLDEGRLDFQLYEDINGNEPTEHQIELWKEGKEKLYLVDYVCDVYEVKRYQKTNY